MMAFQATMTWKGLLVTDGRNFKFKRIFFSGDLEYPAFELFFLLRINAESFFSKKNDET
jgi:hypothetical protein